MTDEDHIYDLVAVWDQKRHDGEEVSAAVLCQDCPELIPALEERIASVKATDRFLDSDTDEDDDFLTLPNHLFKKSVVDFSIPATLTLDQFKERLVASGLMTAEQIDTFSAANANELATKLIDTKAMTTYQAQHICEGNTKGLVLGNYVILDTIGEGGMGQVFKARHKRMKRVVALKVLPDAALKSANAVERFHREVEAVARLEHPNIVTAHDADEFNGTHFLVMQNVQGTDLSSLVKRTGRMPIGKAVNCIIQAAKGLEYAHAEGIVHRDIKPANLLLDRKGRVKILDMGLAKLERTTGGDGFAATQGELTQEGAVLGTVDYMAPEQALDTHLADARADIYSLGCTLYYLLVAQPIYAGSTLMAKMLAHKDKEIPSLTKDREDVPQELDAIFSRMVAKEAGERYPTMTAVLTDLEAVASKYEAEWSEDDGVIATGADVESDVDIKSRDTSSANLADTLATAPKVTPPSASVESAKTQPTPMSRWFGIGGLALLLLGLGGYWLFGVLFSIKTDNGIIQIESSHPDVEVFVDGNKVVHFTDPKDNTKIRVEIPDGANMLRVKKDGFEADVKELCVST